MKSILFCLVLVTLPYVGRGQTLGQSKPAILSAYSDRNHVIVYNTLTSLCVSVQFQCTDPIAGDTTCTAVYTYAFADTICTSVMIEHERMYFSSLTKQFIEGGYAYKGETEFTIIDCAEGDLKFRNVAASLYEKPSIRAYLYFSINCDRGEIAVVFAQLIR